MANPTPTIGMNSFVRRQTADSKFSHFAGSEEELVNLVVENFDNAVRGYRDGVLLVPVPAENFFSGVVEVTPETELRAIFGARRKGEAPYIQILAVGGEKLPAKFVEVVLYAREVLLEDGEDAVSTDCAFEIISINARPTEGVEPMSPVTMARNFLGLAGGTAGEFSAQQFAEAIIYWSTRAMKG